MSRYGLLGRRLTHSYSPQLHALLGNPDYTLFPVEPEALADFFSAGEFDGINVTIPYKCDVLRFCASLSPQARAVGAVNTVVRRPDGTLYGDNTDIDGFSALLALAGGVCPGEKALVLGSGGASQTVRYVLSGVGAEVVTISRSGADHYGNIERHADAVLLVNATPVGMYPQTAARPLCLTRLPRLRAVIDLIYNPLRTRLLQQAQALGMRAVGGLAMLVAQGAAAHERFGFGAVDAARQAGILRRLRGQMENLLLIGMPGSGKTTVGRLLAERLNRQFYDCDEAFSAQFGCSAADYLAHFGEADFRLHETRVLAGLSCRSGCVIATGGGCVTRRENDALLRENSRVLWLQRDLSRLTPDGRPLSLRDGAEALWLQRRARYAALADDTVGNNGTLSQTIETILEIL